jgi:hypothetical protein
LARILACLAHETAAEDLVAAAGSDVPPSRERLCEAYYYAGEACLLNERFDQPRQWFAKAVDTGVAFDRDSTYLDAMNEYHLARWRLTRLTAQGSTVAEASIR